MSLQKLCFQFLRIEKLDRKWHCFVSLGLGDYRYYCIGNKNFKKQYTNIEEN